MWDCLTKIILRCESDDEAKKVYDKLFSAFNWGISLREYLAQMNISIDTSDEEYLGIIEYIFLKEKTVKISVRTQHRPLVAMWLPVAKKYFPGIVSSFQYISKNDKDRKYLCNRPDKCMDPKNKLYHVLCETSNEFFAGHEDEEDIAGNDLQILIEGFFVRKEISFETNEIISLINELSYFDEKTSIFPFEFAPIYTLI